MSVVVPPVTSGSPSKQANPVLPARPAPTSPTSPAATVVTQPNSPSVSVSSPTSGMPAPGSASAADAAVIVTPTALPQKAVALPLRPRGALNGQIFDLYAQMQHDECLRLIERALVAPTAPSDPVKLRTGTAPATSSTGSLISNPFADAAPPVYYSDYPLYVRGLIQRQRAQIGKALESFQAALRVNPRSVPNCKQVARCLFLLGRIPRALAVYQQAAAMLAGPDAPTDTECTDAEILLGQGECHMRAGNFTEAIKVLRASITQRPSDAAYVSLCQALTLAGDVPAALQAHTDALEFSPENADLLTRLGVLYLSAGSPQQAFDLLGTALSHAPSDPAACFSAAAITLNNKEFDAALLKYRVVAHSDPDSAELWTDVGLCLWGKGRHTAASACLKRALFIDPTAWAAAYDLALVCLSTGQHASACHHLTTAVALHPKHAPSFAALGIALGRMGDRANASAAYDRALRLNPQAPVTYLNYAAMLLQASVAVPAAGAAPAGGSLTPEEVKAIALWDRFKSLFATAQSAATATLGTVSAETASAAAASLAAFSRPEIDFTSRRVELAVQQVRARVAADSAVAAATPTATPTPVGSKSRPAHSPTSTSPAALAPASALAIAVPSPSGPKHDSALGESFDASAGAPRSMPADSAALSESFESTQFSPVAPTAHRFRSRPAAPVTRAGAAAEASRDGLTIGVSDAEGQGTDMSPQSPVAGQSAAAAAHPAVVPETE